MVAPQRPRRPRPAAPFAFLLALPLALGSAGCGGGERPPAKAEAAPLPAWEGREREIFDDSIDPAALGLTMEGGSPAQDPRLRERAQRADIVARVRVSTVTVETVGESSRYHLGVQIGTPPLAAPRIPGEEFDLLIKPGTRSHPLAKAIDVRMRGMTFVGFLKLYAHEDGEPTVHFHLAPDTAEVVAAVKEAVALGELSGT